jgi:hypothetical protein
MWLPLDGTGPRPTAARRPTRLAATLFKKIDKHSQPGGETRLGNRTLGVNQPCPTIRLNFTSQADAFPTWDLRPGAMERPLRALVERSVVPEHPEKIGHT